MKMYNNQDMNQLQITNMLVHNLTGAPSSPKKGQIYFNTSDNIMYSYNGSGWVIVTHTGNSVIDLINTGTTSTIGDTHLSAAAQDAITKKHAQNTDTTLTGSGINKINTT